MARRARPLASLLLALTLTGSAGALARANNFDWPASAFAKPEPEPVIRKQRRPPPDPARLVKSPKKPRSAPASVMRAPGDARPPGTAYADPPSSGPAKPVTTSSTQADMPDAAAPSPYEPPARMGLGVPPPVDQARAAQDATAPPPVPPSWLARPAAAAPTAKPAAPPSDQGVPKADSLTASSASADRVSPSFAPLSAGTRLEDAELTAPSRGAAPPAPPAPAKSAAIAPPGPPRPVPPVQTPPPASSREAEARAAAITRGQRLWTLRRGPRHTSLEECDLGLGAGRVVGTFAHLPRHFADAGRVMDLETRIAWCARTYQDVGLEVLQKARSVDGTMASELEDLAIYVASLSASWRLSPPVIHPKEQVTLDVGKALYARRQGPLDFSCATCHGAAGPSDDSSAVGMSAASPVAATQAIANWKGRPVPQLANPADSQAAIGNWPAWSPELGSIQTLQGRLATCFWHMGVEPPLAGSDAMIALVSYLTRQAEKGEVLAPGRRR